MILEILREGMIAIGYVYKDKNWVRRLRYETKNCYENVMNTFKVQVSLAISYRFACYALTKLSKKKSVKN